MSLTYEERTAIRRMIDEKKRELENVKTCPIGKGDEAGYARGCRCDVCREAASKGRRRRARMASLTPEQRAAGVYELLWPEG